MTSKIVVNNIEADAGVSTVTVIGDCQATTFKGDGSNLTSLPSQATIANNADNRVITGGSGVNLNGEANLTFDGNNLTQTIDADTEGFKQTAAGNHYIKNIIDANRSGAGGSILALQANWNGKEVSAIKFRTGADTTNKDDGHICFETSSANNITERLRITSDGKIGINQTSPAHKLHVEDGSSGVIVAKQTTNNGGYNIFEGDASDGTTKFYVTHNGRVGAADGIIFGTDTAAGNILNDYEEGNWSPTDLGGSAYNVAGGAVGKYVKVGGVVHAWAQFGTNTSGNVAVGDRILIGDLPFNVNTVNNPAATVTINYSAATYSTTKAHVTSLNEIAFTVTQTTGHPRSGAGYYVQVTYFTNS